MMMSFSIRALLAVWLVSPLVLAQSEPDNRAWKGRLYCLAAWAKNANPAQPKSLQEAYLGAPSLLPREVRGLESLTFSIDSDSEDASRWFGQGLSCLYLLWDEEAERAFRAVTHADPECAMGYWGLAMVNVDQPGRAAYFTRMAVGKLRPETSPEVRSWVRILERFYEDPEEDIESRVLRLASDFENIAISMPENVEAKALYLRQLVLNAYRNGIEIRSPWAIDRIAEEIEIAQPGHPSASLRHFLWMSSKPGYLIDQGLLNPEAIAEKEIVPRWRFLAEAQLAAGQSEEGTESLVRAVAESVRQRVGWFESPLLVPGFNENVQVLVENLSRQGRVEEALDLAIAMVSQFTSADASAPGTAQQFLATPYAAGLRLYVQICLEHGLDDRLRNIEGELPLRASSGPFELALREEIKAITAGGESEGSTWLSPEARLAQAIAAGKNEEAAELLESLPEGRRRAFLPRALEILHHLQAGKTKEAMFGFDNAFRAAAGSSDSPVCDEKGFAELAKLRRLTGDWKLPATPASHRLEASVAAVTKAYREDFPVAPAFELPDDEGTLTDLEKYKGKPVLVTFFLGAGCPKCVLQLHTFLPLGADFLKAGIPMLAVSTDPVDVIKFTLPEGPEPSPFKVLSDSRLEAFRKYHVVNEFEQRPLHGTFLLDATGKVRWWTTGNQPFMNPKWLLDECKRVLSE
ncbi:peroxiredoxin family protein [Haloferula sp.]|uniref:peroxiredoxin family protein n=1 Tax=Haloferula sp. TaxID=2497595 RepID=UPI00329AE879